MLQIETVQKEADESQQAINPQIAASLCLSVGLSSSNSHQQAEPISCHDRKLLWSEHSQRLFSVTVLDRCGKCPVGRR